MIFKFILIFDQAQRLDKRTFKGNQKFATQIRDKIGFPAGQFGHGGDARIETGFSIAGCAESHCTAATAGEPATISTLATFTSSPAWVL